MALFGNVLIIVYNFVAIAMSKLVCPEFWNNSLTETTISRNDLMECVQFLTDLLQFDFVFIKPCNNLDSMIDSVIRDFEGEEIILMDMVFLKKNCNCD